MFTTRNRAQSVLFIRLISVAFIVNKNVIDKIIDKVHASFTINYVIKVNLKKCYTQEKSLFLRIHSNAKMIIVDSCVQE
jgi:hypothetical protein